jgi:NAD(P)-dependent dehydrogenase (short-subunit alcohol dehydrogenase family)
MIGGRFEGQIAIVTGGADGIGKSIARRLIREGANVTLFDADEQMLARTAREFAQDDLPVQIMTVDVSSEQEVELAVAAVVLERERLDIAVHCAGVVGPNGVQITDVDIAEFDRVYQMNLRGTFLIAKYCLTAMRKRNYGRLLLFASIAGKEGNAGMCCYSATKAGVIGLAKSIGKEFAETGITVNAIAPAVIRTALVDSMNPEQVKYMTDKIPMKRCGTLDEVTALSCWIVSKEAGFNTAFTFDLSGGRAVY